MVDLATCAAMVHCPRDETFPIAAYNNNYNSHSTRHPLSQERRRAGSFEPAANGCAKCANYY